MANEYFLNSPSQQLFYNTMAFLLSIMSLNSGFWDFYKMPNRFVYRLQRLVTMYAGHIALVSQCLYLALNYSDHDFNTLAMIYTVLPVTFVMTVKISVARTPGYKRAMIKFMDQIHMYSYYKHDRRPHVREILIKAELYTRWSVYVISTLCFVCSLAFFVVPIIHSFQNNDSIYNITSRLEIMVHFWLPIDYEFNFFYWIVVQITTLYCVVLCVTLIVLFDMTNLSFLYHLSGHIQILKHILKEEFNEKMSHKDIKNKLVEVTRYYAFIIRIFKDVRDGFGANIVGIYMHNLFGGGLLIYQIMTAGTNTETMLSYGLMIPIYMGELILMSYVIENLRIQADDIPELVYNLHWEKMSIPNQKLVLMILLQVQPVLQLRAALSTKTGVQPAVNIIKTTFSYYVMIKSRM